MESTDPRHLLVAVTKILDRLGISYLITGGIAVLVWGRPRFTADIDIVVELKAGDVPALSDALRGLAPDGYLDPAQMERAIAARGEFNFIDGASGVKVDFWILKEDDAFDRSRLGRRVAKEVLGERVHFSSPEDLILIKLLWYKTSPSSRQLEDAESVFKISGGMLDRAYLREWGARLGVEELLRPFLKQQDYKE
ncbi:MAG: hypothetical protein HY474_00570 [Candidatus Sungbacteria bacterium]|uniref:Nucleotidyl transferase AbiEii/AbiGii toxin family protein n=1 Tax=Candidatus Sungiibacteriota bacterium TaxID=2750080 RepID=A0A932YVC4_9BACT|nr:hypothetical protein [Candidatus Sungbacteria bacterium]